MQKAVGVEHLGPASSPVMCPVGQLMGLSVVQRPEVSQAWVQLIPWGLECGTECAQPTVALPKCTWHHRAGARLVGSDSKLRKADADPRHCWESAAGVQGMGHQHPSARPRSLGQLSVRDTFLQGPVSGAKMGTGISVEIPAFTSPSLRHHSFPGEPPFQDSQLLLWTGRKGLSPEGSGVISELRAAVWLQQCLAGPVAWRHNHMCNEPQLFSAPCFLLLADGGTFPQVGRVIFNCLPCAA